MIRGPGWSSSRRGQGCTCQGSQGSRSPPTGTSSFHRTRPLELGEEEEEQKG